LHALLDPERLTRERQVALIEEELDRLSRPPTSAGKTPGARRLSARRSHA
jgi:hypothetical protein